MGIYILLAVTSWFLIQRYCWMKRLRPTLRVRLRETGSTVVLRTQVVSPTLVESDSMNMVLSEDRKAITIPRCGF